MRSTLILIPFQIWFICKLKELIFDDIKGCRIHRNISLSSMTEKILRKSGGFKLSTQPLIYRILVSGKLSSMSILATRGGNVKPFWGAMLKFFSL